MSYLSRFQSLPQTLSKKLSEPSSLAVLASVGIHGIIFAFLPLLPSFSTMVESGPEGPVPLVELSPEEQQRLPDLERSPISLLPPIGQTDSFGLTPPPPTGNLFPNLVPQRPSIRTTPRTRVIPQIPIRRSPFPGGILVRPDLPPPPSSTARGPSTATPPSVLEGPQDSNAPSDATRGEIGVTGDIPELSSLNPGEPQTQDTDSTSAEDLQPEDSSDSGSADEEADAEATDVEGTDAEGADEEEVAANPAPPEEPADPLLAEIQAMREQYAYDAAGTSNSEATSSFDSWLRSAQEATENPDLLPESPITLTIDYPLRACLPEDPVDASVAVLVDPDGQIVGEPSLLKSTGYPALNQQALNQVRGYGFSAAEDYTAYSFRVEVNYDGENCLRAPS